MRAEITRKWIENIVCIFPNWIYASHIINQCDEELKELEAKAAKWDMIEWAIENEVKFVRTTAQSIYIDKGDLEILEFQYNQQKAQKDGD